MSESATIPTCDFCGKTQTEEGAVLYGPPWPCQAPPYRDAPKWHTCRKCYDKIIGNKYQIAKMPDSKIEFGR